MKNQGPCKIFWSQQNFSYQKKYGFQKKCGSWKNIIWPSNKCWSRQTFGPEETVVPKNVSSEKNIGPKKWWSQKKGHCLFLYWYQINNRFESPQKHQFPKLTFVNLQINLLTCVWIIWQYFTGSGNENGTEIFGSRWGEYFWFPPLVSSGPKRELSGMKQCLKCPICPFFQPGHSVQKTATNRTVDNSLFV